MGDKHGLNGKVHKGRPSVSWDTQIGRTLRKPAAFAQSPAPMLKVLAITRSLPRNADAMKTVATWRKESTCSGQTQFSPNIFHVQLIESMGAEHTDSGWTISTCTYA
jgi:hypothetical protein